MKKLFMVILFFSFISNAFGRGPAGNFSFTEETGERIEDYNSPEDFHEAREEWEEDNIEDEYSCKRCEHWEYLEGKENNSSDNL